MNVGAVSVLLPSVGIEGEVCTMLLEVSRASGRGACELGRCLKVEVFGVVCLFVLKCKWQEQTDVLR
jgi:hypothetical protein